MKLKGSKTKTEREQKREDGELKVRGVMPYLRRAIRKVRWGKGRERDEVDFLLFFVGVGAG
jgi:hypothetical protein